MVAIGTKHHHVRDYPHSKSQIQTIPWDLAKIHLINCHSKNFTSPNHVKPLFYKDWRLHNPLKLI